MSDAKVNPWEKPGLTPNQIATALLGAWDRREIRDREGMHRAIADAIRAAVKLLEADAITTHRILDGAGISHPSDATAWIAPLAERVMLLRLEGEAVREQAMFIDSDHAHKEAGLADALRVMEARAEKAEAEIARLREALEQYASRANWSEHENGVDRVWEEPETTTPDSYAGYELAAAALKEAPDA